MTTTTEPIAAAGNPKEEWLPTAGSCPAWCTGDHHQALVEGCTWKQSQEHGGLSHQHHLAEIRNSVDSRVMRPGGGRWAMYPRVHPFGSNGGYRDEPSISLTLSEGFESSATLFLTGGDARVMARQLLDLADKLDLT